MTGQFESAAPLIESWPAIPLARPDRRAGNRARRRQARRIKLDNTARPFALIATDRGGHPENGTATFSWRELASDKPLTDSDRRAFIEFKPILDFNALEPGKDATDAIRQAAKDLNFAGEYQARASG